MSYYGHRNVSNSLGFAMGWLYFYSLGILVPYEITAAGLVIDYWPSNINIAVWITIFIVVIVGLNILPVQFYGETEFVRCIFIHEGVSTNELEVVRFSQGFHDDWSAHFVFHPFLGRRS